MNRPFAYVAPENLTEGLAAIAGSNARRRRPLAGGTDLVPLLKTGIERPEALVSLRAIRDLPRRIDCSGSEVRLGALCTLADIENDPRLADLHPALVQAAAAAASPQLRNMATLGGTLLQRPRCWYFRHPDFHCWLKGGDVCQARDGVNPGHAIFDTGVCRAAHPSDVACALLALDARIEIVGPDGERERPLHELLRPPEDHRRRETLLADDELIRAVRIPATAAGTRSLFLKAMDRGAWSFATVSVAARVAMEQGRYAQISLVLGAVATIPWSVSDELAPLIGEAPDEARIAAALRGAVDAHATPLAMNGYKVPLARALARRALVMLGDPTGQQPAPTSP